MIRAIALAGVVIPLGMLAATMLLARRARKRGWAPALVVMGLGLRAVASAPGVVWLGQLLALAATQGRLGAFAVRATQDTRIYSLTHLDLAAVCCWMAAAAIVVARGVREGTRAGWRALRGPLLLGAVLLGLWRFDPYIEEVEMREFTDLIHGGSRIEFRAAATPTIVATTRQTELRQIGVSFAGTSAQDYLAHGHSGAATLGIGLDADGHVWSWHPREPEVAMHEENLPMLLSTASLGQGGACGLELDGRGVCWAKVFSSRVVVPIPVETPIRAIEMSSDCSRSQPRVCALLDGDARCWLYAGSGFEEDGSLGIDVVAMTSRFGCVGCVALSDGAVDCSMMRFDRSKIRRRVDGVADAVFLASSSDLGCAIQRTGEMLCWQLSLNVQIYRSPEELVQHARAVLPGHRIGHVAISEGHSCAVEDTGAVFCWGANGWGQLGDGTTEDRTDPVRVVGIEDATMVAVQGATTCVLHASGSVSCWGMRQRFGATGDRP